MRQAGARSEAGVEGREEAEAHLSDASIVCALLLILGVIGTVRLMGSLGRVGLWGSIGVIVLLITVFLGLPIAAFATLVTHFKKNRQCRQYASGWREPFKVPSEEGMSYMAAYYIRPVGYAVPNVRDGANTVPQAV